MKQRYMFGFLLSVGAGTGAWGAPATLVVQPGHVIAARGATVEVEVRVTAQDQIGALQFTLDFDSTVARFVDVRIGSDLQARGLAISYVNTNLAFPPAAPGCNDHVLVQIYGGASHWFTGSNQQAAVLRFTFSQAWCRTSPLAFDPICSHTQLVTFQVQSICTPELQLVGGALEIGCISDAAPFASHGFRLLQNVPNPFHPSTSIAFELVRAGRVELVVVGVDGRRIRTLVDATLPAGTHRSTWDGRDARGAAVPSGIYYCALRTADGGAARPMLRIR